LFLMLWGASIPFFRIRSIFTSPMTTRRVPIPPRSCQHLRFPTLWVVAGLRGVRWPLFVFQFWFMMLGSWQMFWTLPIIKMWIAYSWYWGFPNKSFWLLVRFLKAFRITRWDWFTVSYRSRWPWSLVLTRVINVATYISSLKNCLFNSFAHF
jgi:hypothetical protein